MRFKTFATAASLTMSILAASGLAFAVCSPSPGLLGGCGGKPNPFNLILCGRYSLSFSAAVVPIGQIGGVGAVTSDCKGNLSGVETITDLAGDVCPGTIDGTYSMNFDGTGTANLSFIPTDVSRACPIVDFTETLAVAQKGSVVKAVNTSGAEVTTQEEWLRQ